MFGCLFVCLFTFIFLAFYFQIHNLNYQFQENIHIINFRSYIQFAIEEEEEEEDPSFSSRKTFTNPFIHPFNFILVVYKNLNRTYKENKLEQEQERKRHKIYKKINKNKELNHLSVQQ
jgi:hypothetical protein